MNLPSLNVPSILRAYNLRPKKGLGQNFLTDPSALQTIVETAGISTDATVVEIGPGIGSLTRYLAVSARKVIAVELDGALLPALEQVIAPWGNVIVIQGDILTTNLSSYIQKPGYFVVANIPYYITSAVIRHLLEVEHKPNRIVLTVQQEVAERICAVPGKLSLLALSVQVYGKPKIVGKIPAGAFYPPPKVDSAIVRIDIYPDPLIPESDLDDFFHLAKAGFSQKRKTLRNALSGGLAWERDRVEAMLESAGIDPQRRAETLFTLEWQELVKVYSNLNRRNG